MFYLCNVQDWFKEIIKQIQSRDLSPEESTFMLFFFSSFDEEYIDFFKNKKEQISSYSGHNFHIFTPIIFENNVIPDSEWRSIRKDFEEMGIDIGNRPFAIIFNLSKDTSGYQPNYIGGYSLEYSKRLDYFVRDIIDLFLMRKMPQLDYSYEIEKILSSPNKLKSFVPKEYSFLHAIDSNINMPTVFLSHFAKDKDFVRRLRAELITNSVRVWFDETNILAGDSIIKEINKGIKKSDYCLFVISENSISSDWTKYEVYQFLNSFDQKKVIPILIDKSISKLPATLNSLRELKYIDFSSSTKWNKNISELIKAIRGY